MAHDAETQWFTVAEIAAAYGRGVGAARAFLNRKLQQVPKDRLKASYRAGKGQNPAYFSAEFIRAALGEMPNTRLSDTEREVFSKDAPTIKVIGGENGDPVTGVLASRRRSMNAYNDLVNEMTRAQKGLRIRCITGTDFFNSHLAWADSVSERQAKSLDVPKIVLVYPFGLGAQIRSSAEGESRVASSQFTRDAQSTFSFLAAEKKLKFDVKWADQIPPSLLIWTEKYALIEAYDYGRRADDRAGCIGRKAPVFVVSGGTEYHETLKNSFDYIFNGDERNTHIKTYSAAQVREQYRKRLPDLLP